jgi:uncharacterized protein YdhG (YjbR/CyaY superfamily)
MSTKKETPKSTTRALAGSAREAKAAASKKTEGLSKEEIAAMKETLKERKMAANKEEAEKAVLEKIAEMPEPDRSMARRIHAIIKDSAPTLSPKTWYGMPAYANQDGKIICFFQTGQKFGSRYATFGFQDAANLDDGAMWPTSFALTELTAAGEAKIVALVKKAVS